MKAASLTRCWDNTTATRGLDNYQDPSIIGSMMIDKETTMKVPQDVRGYALDLVENGLVDMEVLLRACLGYMSTDEVAHMLDLNEMSPRFLQEELE